MALQALVTAHAAFVQPLLQEQLRLQAVDRCRRHPRLHGFRQGLYRALRERHRLAAVEAILDAAHALMDQGVFRLSPSAASFVAGAGGDQGTARIRARTFNDLWRTLPKSKDAERVDKADPELEERKKSLNLRKRTCSISLRRTALSWNPGSADSQDRARHRAIFLPAAPDQDDERGLRDSYTIARHALRPRGRSPKARCWRSSATTPTSCPASFDDPRYSGINPYALEFRHDAGHQTHHDGADQEDREWFPDIASNGDWLGCCSTPGPTIAARRVLRAPVPEPRADPPAWRLFVLGDAADQPHYEVASINERGYKAVRNGSPTPTTLGAHTPDIQVVDVDLLGDRQLRLQRTVTDGVVLDAGTRDAALKHIRRLWGYDVSLVGIDAENGARLYEARRTGSDE